MWVVRDLIALIVSRVPEANDTNKDDFNKEPMIIIITIIIFGIFIILSNFCSLLVALGRSVL